MEARHMYLSFEQTIFQRTVKSTDLLYVPTVILDWF